MPFTVDDFRDLLRLLEQHPEWQAELRRHVLSEELLGLPAPMRELVAAQTRTEQRLADLAEALVALTRRVDTIAEDLAALTRREAPIATGGLSRYLL